MRYFVNYTALQLDRWFGRVGPARFMCLFVVRVGLEIFAVAVIVSQFSDASRKIFVLPLAVPTVHAND